MHPTKVIFGFSNSTNICHKMPTRYGITVRNSDRLMTCIQCGVIYIDSKGSKCIMTPAGESKKQIDSKYPACFKCTVVEDRSSSSSSSSNGIYLSLPTNHMTYLHRLSHATNKNPNFWYDRFFFRHRMLHKYCRFQ
jgi:hypothetical protein